jgi:hypothetical protein
MNEYLALSVIYIIFLFFSYLMYIGSIRLKSDLFFIISVIYFFGIYFYFEFFNQLDHYLRDNRIYVEFGHANLDLIMLMVFCYSNGLIVITIILYKRWKIKGPDRL